MPQPKKLATDTGVHATQVCFAARSSKGKPEEFTSTLNSRSLGYFAEAISVFAFRTPIRPRKIARHWKFHVGLTRGEPEIADQNIGKVDPVLALDRERKWPARVSRGQIQAPSS